MAIVHVVLVEGRSEDQKRAIAEGINKVMVEVAGSPADHVNIIFQEIKRDNWAIAGQLMPTYVANLAAARANDT